MLKFRLTILFTLVALMSPFSVTRATDSALWATDSIPRVSRFAAGVENTRLVFGQYTFKDKFTVRLNVSVYSEKPQLQYARVTAGYLRKQGCLRLSGCAFFGTAFDRSYYNAGAKVAAEARLARRLLLDACIAPWYDSGYKYVTAWEAKLGCVITKHIDIKAGYTTMPEYRMSENRILVGFDFHVEHLSVSPYLSIGTKAEDGGKNLRAVFGFRYDF